jgi:protocatechuate 3,4-dioxygenase beta subunit
MIANGVPVAPPAGAASSITAAAIASAGACGDPRLKTVYEALIRHLHAFVSEVQLTDEEWLTAIRFLTATGQRCDDVRQEFILLSDTCGVTALVDEIAAQRASAPGVTESTVLGPFFVEDAPEIGRGGTLATRADGVPLLVSGAVRDTNGAPVANAVLDVWGTDGTGSYDSQYDDRRVDCRGRVRTADDGTFAFRTDVPVSYPVPTDGPVGTLLNALGRHAMRPAHLHFRIHAEGYRPLTTAIYVAGDPYLDSDAVFGVRDSLIDEFRPGRDAAGNAIATLERDFVLAPAS